MTHSAKSLLDALSARPSRLERPSFLIVAAHPDDEIIGAGTRLPHLPGVRIARLTDGSPYNLHDANLAGFTTRESYARARRKEVRAALALARVTPDRQHDLGCVDQQAPRHLAELVEKLADLFRRFGPHAVLTHPYEGGHPDHDAAAFVVQLACRALLLGGTSAPVRLEFTSYHRRAGKLVVGRFLKGPRARVVRLSARERELKQKMFDCFPSQRQVLAQFPIGVERFRPAPEYDFTRPPHRGRLNYEYYDWGIDAEGWRQEAKRALRKLGVRS